MIKDFGKVFIQQKNCRDLIELAEIKQWVESGDLLKSFTEWRETMWKERIAKVGRHDPRDPKYYKNPELYGYNYISQNSPKGKQDF